MKGKYVLTYRKLQNVSPEYFIRKPNQADLIGAWVNVLKKDTTTILNFKTNNVLEIKDPRTNSESFGRYIADFEKQPMTLDIINQKGDISPNIFVFVGNSDLRLAGPKNRQRRSHFTFFGDNAFFQKKKL